MGTAEPAGPSISVSACRDLSQCGGLSSWRQSKLFPAEAGIPVMIAGSIQLAVPSQLKLCEIPAGPAGPPMWLTLLEDEEDEEEEEFGRPPKLILMFGRRALRPSCHSFTFKPSIELLFSEMGIPPSPVLC